MLSRRKKVYIKVFLNKFMLIIVIHNNNNSFLFFWLRIIIVITWFIENLMIYWYFWYYLRSPEIWHWHVFFLYLHYSHLYYVYNSTFTFLFITLSNHIWFCKIIRACDVLSPSVELSFLHHKKGWYCRCRLFKSEKWCHPLKDDYLWQLANTRCSKFFAFK